MIFFLIVIISLISAYLFDILKVVLHIRYLFYIQRESFKIIADKELTDDEKQKKMLSNAWKIFLTSMKLLLFFFIVLIPFELMVIFAHILIIKVDPIEILFSFKGICYSTISFLIYYFIKKRHERNKI